MDSRISNAHARRRAAKRQTLKPRFVNDILEPLRKAQFQTSHVANKEHTVKAKCNRLRGRTEVIGHTVFPFDEDGICEVDVNASPYARQDFKVLLQRNGITEIPENVPVHVPKETSQAVLKPDIPAQMVPITDRKLALEHSMIKVPESTKQLPDVSQVTEGSKTQSTPPSKIASGKKPRRKAVTVKK